MIMGRVEVDDWTEEEKAGRGMSKASSGEEG